MYIFSYTVRNPICRILLFTTRQTKFTNLLSKLFATALTLYIGLSAKFSGFISSITTGWNKPKFIPWVKLQTARWLTFLFSQYSSRFFFCEFFEFRREFTDFSFPLVLGCHSNDIVDTHRQTKVYHWFQYLCSYTQPAVVWSKLSLYGQLR